MHIVIRSTDSQKELLAQLLENSSATVSWVDNGINPPEAAAYFDFCFEEEGYAFESVSHQPVFVNAVLVTSAELPANCIRFNGWNGFINQRLLEIATSNPANIEKSLPVMVAMNFKYINAPDEPGMMSARVVAMIINEAYFGLGDQISSKKEMDTAMKLGTNYPYGPFEWSEMIGLKKIHALLSKLSKSNARYTIAPMIHKELNDLFVDLS